MTTDDATVPDALARYTATLGPEPDDVIEEMGRRARREGFPYVGPEVGGWLAVLARLTDADRVFEFGSGFGYSAYWFARELPADGEIVLTEIDADELDAARDYFARGGLTGRARFEEGDAIGIVDRYEGPFDVVLIDCQKERYTEAFESVRAKVAPGGVIAADNAATAGHVDFEALLAHAEGETVGMDDPTRGIADYLDAVRADPAFETVLLPLGEGVAVSHRDPESE